MQASHEIRLPRKLTDHSTLDTYIYFFFQVMSFIEERVSYSLFSAHPGWKGKSHGKITAE